MKNFTVLKIVSFIQVKIERGFQVFLKIERNHIQNCSQTLFKQIRKVKVIEFAIFLFKIIS